MTQLLVRYSPADAHDACPLCGQETALAAGPQLVVADSGRPVCGACGRRHDPPLAALVQLADEARRVGRIGRHTVVPPYTALLELAQAADNFAAASTGPGQGG
jgi:hypothetical protein